MAGLAVVVEAEVVVADDDEGPGPEAEAKAGCRSTLRPPLALLVPIAAETRALRAASLSAADSGF